MTGNDIVGDRADQSKFPDNYTVHAMKMKLDPMYTYTIPYIMNAT